MNAHRAFIITDLLTLLAAKPLYPIGFVGIGRNPGKFFCLKQLEDKHIKELVEALRIARKEDKFFLLMPTPDVADRMKWDMATPKCSACGKFLNDHT